MKKTELKSWRGKKVEELIKIAKDKRLTALKAMAKMNAGQEKNLKKPKNLKRELAQILTIIKEMEIANKLKEVSKVKQ